VYRPDPFRGRMVCKTPRSGFIRPPGTAVPEGLMFYNRRYTTDIIFLSPLDLRDPSADRRETLARDQ